MKDHVPLSLMLGAATGIRSTAGFGALAATAGIVSGSRLASPRVRRLVAGAVVGETLADKVAPLPPRTDPLPLGGRAVLGGAAAVVAASWIGGSRVGSAVIGTLAAAGSAWVATRLRSAVRERGTADVIPALGEDLVVAGLATATTERLSRALSRPGA